MAIFEVKIDEKFSLKGNDYLIENPKAHLLVITGMNEHSRRYESFAHELNKEFYSVSVLDHFGQGENAKSVEEQERWPKGAWKMMLQALNNKVMELRKDDKPVYLMGHSMGSFAMQAYLETYPESVDKVIIVSSNGKNNKLNITMGYHIARMRANEKNWDEEDKLMENLSLGPYIRSVKDRTDDNDWLSFNKENVKRYNDDPYCGHYNTHGFFVGFMTGLHELYKKKNLKKISKNEKILIIAGCKDPVGSFSKGPKSLKQMYLSLGIKNVSLILYPDMRHEILNEVERDKVIKDIVRFLDR
jgi:alpha-beta hydrolase superfamily lysophospholipase